MTQKQKIIIGVNIAIFIMYALYSMSGGEGALIAVFLHGLHLIICVIISLFCFGSKDKELGKGFLLSVGVLLLVSLTFCTGVSIIFN